MCFRTANNNRIAVAAAGNLCQFVGIRDAVGIGIMP
jgi:hypothetical protein